MHPPWVQILALPYTQGYALFIRSLWSKEIPWGVCTANRRTTRLWYDQRDSKGVRCLGQNLSKSNCSQMDRTFFLKKFWLMNQSIQLALLTIYDMCKAVDRGMVIESVRLEEKSGGKSGHWRRSDFPDA